jgi:uncharacterized protein YjdB
MKQKLFFLALTLLFLSVTSMNAQVQIGGTAGPNSSAILDLNPDEGDATLGLKLPVIELGDVSLFQLSGTAEDADGITVYNSSDATIGGSGKGIYVWNGSKWNFTGKSGQITPVENPVTNITITSAGDVVVINSGAQLQLTAHLEPAVPSNSILNWTIVYDPAVTAGRATIDGTGLITAVRGGLVTARATATDGSGVYRNFVFNVIPGEDEVPEIAVTKIDITSADYATELNASGAGSTLQLTATVAPDNASNKTLRWTQVYNPATTAGKVTVDESGLVTGVKAGTVTVRATATDGSGVYGSLTLNVKPTSQVSSITIAVINNLPTVEAGYPLNLQATVEPITAYQGVLWSSANTDIASVNVTTGLVSTMAEGNVIITATAQDGSNVNQQIEITVTELAPLATTTVTIGGENYQAYTYLGKQWTVENMRHGTAAYTYYPPYTERVVSYYNNTQFQSICTDGFRVPTIDDWSELQGLLNSGLLSATEASPWYGPAALVGYVSGSTGSSWGVNTYTWTANPLAAAHFRSDRTNTISSYTATDSYRFTVKCVRDL